MNTPISTAQSRLPSVKQLGYQAVYWTNRSFEEVLVNIDRLEHLGILQPNSLNEFRTRIEHVRARVNHKVIESLQ